MEGAGRFLPDSFVDELPHGINTGLVVNTVRIFVPRLCGDALLKSDQIIPCQLVLT